MARKPARTFGTSKLSLWNQILEITGPVDDGSLTSAKIERVLALWVKGAGGRLLWAYTGANAIQPITLNS